MKMSPLRLATLFCVFLLIALGLGYPILNRYDPRQTPGLSDVQSYAALVTGGPVAGPAHVRFRLLLPWIARPFYHVAQERLGSWDPIIFGLLCADSLFVAATGLLIVALGIRLQLHAQGKTRLEWTTHSPISLVAALLYFVNFAVPNLRLTGLVDAGEGFFLVALLWALAQRQFFLLPFIGVLGALSKESFVPLSIVFTAVWLLTARKKQASKLLSAAWIANSWLASFIALAWIQWRITGEVVSPVSFAASLHGNDDYLHHIIGSVIDRNFWYIFIWLLPLALPKLRALPKTWLIPTAATAASVFILDAYYGGAPGTVGRELFSVAGPILSLSAAAFLCNPETISSSGIKVGP
jgi:hypothetical protein